MTVPGTKLVQATRALVKAAKALEEAVKWHMAAEKAQARRPPKVRSETSKKARAKQLSKID